MSLCMLYLLFELGKQPKHFSSGQTGKLKQDVTNLYIDEQVLSKSGSIFTGSFVKKRPDRTAKDAALFNIQLHFV